MHADTVDDAASIEISLRARAEVLARQQIDHEQGSVTSIVLDIGELRVAVPVHRVRTVAAPGPVADVPRSAHLLIGARLVAGEVIALADVGPVLGSSSDAPASGRSVVVLDSEAPLGIVADRVSNVEVDAAVATGEASPSGLVAGITGDGLLLLDVDALLADPRFMTAPVGSDAQAALQDPTKGSS